MSEHLCSDLCARLKMQISMHSIKIVRHCDPISLLINKFGMHLETGCKSHEQIVHYRTAKNVQKQATVLLYFLDEFSLIDPEGISCRLTKLRPCASDIRTCALTNPNPNQGERSKSTHFPASRIPHRTHRNHYVYSFTY